jgi:uncharacterized protein (DUF2126 family)
MALASSGAKLNRTTRSFHMRLRARMRAGKIKYGLAAWLLGLPLPIVIIALFWRGCDF